MKSLSQISEEKILVLDGAMGTMIQRWKLGEEDFRNERLQDHPSPLMGNNDLLSITRPEIIADIHRQYLKAGADIIETNTFNANRISQADYGLEDLCHELNVASARLARQAADEIETDECPRFVAGSIGPTNKTASLSPDVNNPGYRAVSFDDLASVYAEQTEALIEGGVDILLVETVFDTLNAKAALFGIQEVFEKLGKEYPIMVSGTITDASGRTLSGQTARAFLVSVEHANLFSIGFNCALGAAQLLPHLDAIDPYANCKISAHPNAGLPNEMGSYDQGPAEMAEEIRSYLERDLVDIIGGCCGTTPEHIEALAELTRQYSPRKTRENV